MSDRSVLLLKRATYGPIESKMTKRHNLKGVSKILSDVSKNYSHLKSFSRKGFFAILDQGLFSGTNFLINIVLARTLEPVQYGAFAVAFSVFLVLSTFHTAVLTEPMLVYGPGKYAEKFQKYLGILIYGHCGVVAVIALVLALVAVVFWRLESSNMAQALGGLAFASPFILFMWMIRRAFYVRAQPQWAAAGGISMSLT